MSRSKKAVDESCKPLTEASFTKLALGTTMVPIDRSSGRETIVMVSLRLCWDRVEGSTPPGSTLKAPGNEGLWVGRGGGGLSTVSGICRSSCKSRGDNEFPLANEMIRGGSIAPPPDDLAASNSSTSISPPKPVAVVVIVPKPE